MGKLPPDRLPKVITTRFASAADAPPEKEPIVPVTVAVLSAQFVFFPCVMVGLRLALPEAPFAKFPNVTALAVTVEGVAAHSTEPLTFTSVAKAAEVLIKVVTASTMRAIAASLDLLELVNILFSLSFVITG
jgi:hypothetical protein